jgi:23S rRNA (adenine2030-N6)-methyltransferase
MLSYRHGFHAGNAADVLKHGVLLFCLEYLCRKERPCLYVDTHAGAGSYLLDDGFAAQKREWEGGLGRLAAAAREGPLPALAARYLALAGGALPGAGPGEGRKERPPYPGSPAIMGGFLRPGDRLVAFELHPADYTALAAELAPCSGAQVRREDGFKGLPALLPPPSRRGCVLIDPPYEVKDDFDTLPGALREALKRFPQGIYLVWYPLLRGRAGEKPPPRDFGGELLGLYPGNRCRVELHTAAETAPPAASPRGMYGSGLVIYNPPWTLRDALEAALPPLARILGAPGVFRLWWETPSRPAAVPSHG